MDFAVLIREIRQESLLSQEMFAVELGVSFSTVNRWEKGKTLPNYQTMKKLEQYCNDNHVDFKNADKTWKEVKNGIHSY